MRMILAATLAIVPLLAKGSQSVKRLDEAALVFSEVMAAPDKGIPQDMLANAHCIIIVPGLKTAAFVFGGKYGKGYVSCRKKSAAAGPVGRTATAQTDAQMHAEILSWSRSQGLFAGLALEGATLRQDLDDNVTLYGKRLENRQIETTSVRAPKMAAKLIALLNKYSVRERTSMSAGSSQ